jgi:hypothetical protein
MTDQGTANIRDFDHPYVGTLDGGVPDEPNKPGISGRGGRHR